jgi:hypothetical protein
VEITPQKYNDQVIGSLERTAKLVKKNIKGNKLQLVYEDDNWDEGMNDVEVMMETDEHEEVIVPMQLTALEAARVAMERRDTQWKEEERMGHKSPVM